LYARVRYADRRSDRLDRIVGRGPITPKEAWQARGAIPSASRQNVVFGLVDIGQPTTRREKRSTMTAR
jgi:hypothetical protein